MRHIFKKVALALAVAGVASVATQARATEYLLVSNGGLNAPTQSVVLKYNATTGAVIGNFVNPGNGLDGPRGLAFGPNGNLFVANNAGNDVLEYNGSTGAFVKTFVTPGSGGLAGPEQLVFNGNDLYVSGFTSKDLLKYNATTGAFESEVIPAASNTGGADGLAIAGGKIYLAGSQTGNLVQTNLDGSQGKTLVSGFGNHGPRDVLVDGSGDLLVTTGSNNPQPNGVSAFPVDAVEKFSPTGTDLGTLVASGSGGLSQPRHLEFGPNGNLFVVSQQSNAILEYDKTSGAFVTEFASGGGLNRPTYFTFHDVVPVGPPPAVPLPPAALTGAAMLAGLGAIAVVKRKKAVGVAL